jgi:soluble lytic murein transglycosylase-like protein
MYILKLISFIVPRFRDTRKTIRLLLAILMINCSVQSCFAEDLVALIDKTEQEYAIPSGLLKSITSVESSNKPYALNVAGKAIFVDSKEEAMEIVHLYRERGITNIDLGLAQINLHWHGRHFNSISEMLEPKSNLEYAAKFLRKLYEQHGSWNKAVRHYHSANPLYHIKYSRKVLISWLSSGS